MKGNLSSSFSAEEVSVAVFDLNPTKNPGPDDFQAIFFQKSWDLIRGDVTKVCLSVLNGSSSIREFNETNVVLIPKSKYPVKLKDFLLISICSVIYKIVTKVLAFRLKGILQSIISPSKSAFVSGRQIYDNFLVASGSLHSLSCKKSVSRRHMALKIDMSKAYDRVEWVFLKAVMERMNFPTQWINLVLNCISSSSLSFLLNGKAICSITPLRGLRQGCPLSLYLFLLCVEALSGLISISEMNGRVLGTDVVEGVLWSAIFSSRMIVFYLARQEILSLLQIDDNNSQDKYLGLPTSIGRNKRILFSDIKERFWKRLRNWKGSMFSFNGKEVLIKAVAPAIPTYSIGMFKIPISMCIELSSMASKFWRGSKDAKRKISWTSWQNLCKRKCLGGLGFKDLSIFNQALLAKQSWRFLSSSDSLAARVLKAKYFSLVDFLDASIKVGCSHVWRSQTWGRELLSKRLRWSVGDGNGIRVFKDKWIPRPSSFRSVTSDPGTNILVYDLIDRSRRTWNREKLNQVLLPVDREAILSIHVSWRGGQDSLKWHYEKSGVYSVSSGYRLALSEKY
ncbi:hypothetical protein Ddye_001338 [Dipteronia dyeriana]|uniref:Reverse transcriptase domain-containing protein n=1 Tax=Dipteronia dyeriana TaxID=168575 RepID=A0AAD9XND9_9ROSI|nr:hypothetical protein Ddye_001338 [Dipteronia dyeriana]